MYVCVKSFSAFTFGIISVLLVGFNMVHHIVLLLLLSLLLSIVVADDTFNETKISVASLGGHHPSYWSKKSTTCNKNNISQLINCNLNIYKLAIAKASEEGAQLIVLPEAYGITDTPTKKDHDEYFEPFLSNVGVNLCGNSTINMYSPKQYEISCFAKTYQIAIAANIFVTLTNNNTNRIQEIIFDHAGKVISTYSKIHLFPTEKKFAEPGPFLPTHFNLFGKIFGILVCYDGVYPYISNNFSELNALKENNVDTIIWSAGSMVPIVHLGKLTATKYNFTIIASEDSSFVTGTDSAMILSKDGVPYDTQKDIPILPPKDYTGKNLHIRVVEY